MGRRLGLLAFAAGLFLAITPAIASAGVSPEGACWGTAIIKGETYTPANDTRSNAIPIPNEEGVEINYTGMVDFDNMDHNGGIAVRIAGFDITIATWGDPNTADTRDAAGVYELDDAYAKIDDVVPFGKVPGIWQVSGWHHAAAGGECTGTAMIKIEGNPLSNPLGWISLGGLVLFGAGVGWAAFARPGRP
jgi:hypothetical protein